MLTGTDAPAKTNSRDQVQRIYLTLVSQTAFRTKRRAKTAAKVLIRGPILIAPEAALLQPPAIRRGQQKGARQVCNSQGRPNQVALDQATFSTAGKQQGRKEAFGVR